MALTILPGSSTLKKGLELVSTITIDGVEIRSAVNVSNGFRNEQEVIGEDGNAAAVVLSNDGMDIAVTGYLGKGATLDSLKNGTTVTVTGYDIAYLSGVTINATPEGVTTFSGTIKCRHPTA